jgi:hypothetical protein
MLWKPTLLSMVFSMFSIGITTVGCAPERPVDVGAQAQPTDESPTQFAKKAESRNPCNRVTDSNHKEIPEEEFNVLETVKFNWDGDGVPETFILEHRKDWNDFLVNRITITTSKNCRLVFENYVEGWAKYKFDAPESFLEVGNIADSEYLFFLKVTSKADERWLLFFFGPAYGSSLGSLDILSIEGGLPHSIFSEEYFSLGNVKDIDGDGLADVVGFPCSGEYIGDNYFPYIPALIFQLSGELGKANLSLDLSEKYNQEKGLGWAGPICRYDIVEVYKPPDGGPPRIMSKADADKLFAKKP